MLILSQKDFLFNYEDCEKLFEENKKDLLCEWSFYELLDRSHFYSFFDGSKHLGCIYYFIDDGKVFVNGFANRHQHKQNLECLKATLDFYNCDIYANSYKKTSVLCLLKCGFKKISNNLYKHTMRKKA